MSEENKNKKKPRVTAKTLKSALTTIRSLFKAGEVKKMAEISEIYSTGLYSALGMGYNTMVTRFQDPSLLTLGDLLDLSDISETDVDLILSVALKEAQKNHIKRDISHLLGEKL